MAERDRAAIDVGRLPRRLQLAVVVERGDGVGFVQLPQVDVAHGETVVRHQLADGRGDGDAHLFRMDSAKLHATEQAEDGKAALCRNIRVHHHQGGRAIRELRGVASRCRAALEDGLELREAFESGVGARAFVVIERHLLHTRLAGGLVGDLHRRREGRDFLGILAGSGCDGDAPLTFHDIGVERFTGDAVFLRHEIGSLVHRPPHGGHDLLQRFVEEAVQVEVELDEADAFDAAGDAGYDLAGGDTRCEHGGSRNA